MADLSVVKSWALPQFDPTPEEARMLTEIRARESSGDYAARNPKPGSTAAGAYQFIGPTWQLATKNTGAPVYSSAAEAPQVIQDANALHMLRQYGPNSTTTWAASGPYNQAAPASAETPDKPAASLTVVKSWPLPQEPAAAEDMPAITIGKPLAAPANYGEIRTPSPFPGPRQTPPPAEKTVGGFIENAFTSTGNLIDALASPILRPKETLQGITALGQAMSEKSGFAPVMGQSHLEALDAIGDLYKQRYGSWQGFKDAAYKDPAGIAADLLTVVDGLGLGFQAANDFAKVAGLSDVAANAVSKAVTAAKGAAIGTVKAIPRVPAGMVKGALAGEVLSPERWPQLAGLGGLNELRKGAAGGKKLALDARAKAITEAFEAEQQARAAEVARIRERLKAVGIPAERGGNRTGWTGTGDVSSPFPGGGGGGTPGPAPAPAAPAGAWQQAFDEAAQMYRAAHPDWTDEEIVHWAKGVADDAHGTQPAAKTAAGSAGAPNAPSITPAQKRIVKGAQQAGEFTPEETARAAAILENVEPQAPPAPSAPAATSTSTTLKPGEYVQWEYEGRNQYSAPQKITGFTEDGKYAFVEGSPLAAPVEQLKVAVREPAAQPAAPTSAEVLKQQLRAEMEKSGTIAPGEALAPDVAEPDVSAVVRESETAPTPLKQEIVNSANYARYLRKQGWTAADAQKMTAAERQTLAKGFGNDAPSDAAWERTLFQMRRVEKSGYEYGVPITKTTTPAEATAKFQQARKGLATATKPARAAGEASPGSMAASLGPEWNRHAYLQAKRGSLTDAEWNEFVKLDEKFGPEAPMATAPTPATDLETQLADSLAGKRTAPPPEGPAKPTASETRVETIAKHLAELEGLNPQYLTTLTEDPQGLETLAQLGRDLKVREPQSPGEVQQIVDRVRQLRGEKAGPPATEAGPGPEGPQTLRTLMEGEKPAASPETLPAAKQPWQMSEAEWETYKQANVPEFVEAGLEYKQRYTGKHETVRGVWKDALDVLENSDKHIAEWGKTYRDTVNKADAWLEQHPDFAKSHEQHIAEAVEAGKTLSPENARTYSDVIADTRKEMERAAEPVRPPAPSPRKRRSK